MINGLINHAYIMSLHRNPSFEFQRAFFVDEHMEAGVGTPGEGMELPCSFTNHISIWLFLSCVLCNKMVI